MNHSHYARQIVWCAVLGTVLSSLAHAEMGVVETLPGPRTRMRNSLTVQVDTRGVSANGYRPVKITLSNTPVRNKPPVAVTFDRRIRVVLSPIGWGHLSSVSTSQVIEIPEGQATAEAIVAIPTAGDWQQMEVAVYEGGDKLEDVTATFATGFFGLRADAETLPTLLIVDYDVPSRAARDLMLSAVVQTPAGTNDTFLLPDFSQLLSNFNYTNYGIATAAPQPVATAGTVRLSDVSVLTLASQQVKLQLLPPNELPKRWIDLSCFDIAFISVDDLARMAKDDAPQKRALVNWLHGGPSLVVYGAKEDFSRLAEIETLLELTPLSDAGDSSDPANRWIAAVAGDRYKTRVVNSQPQVMYGPLGARAYAAGSTTVMGSAASPSDPLPAKTPFVGRPAGMGWVVALADENPFPGKAADWNWVINSIPTRHQLWATRHGITYQSYNRGIWNWYIPGVGAAPVFSFLLLATLFAVIIGPVNYLILGKIQRLYLLLLTVPAGAIVVTLGLFAYAILSDGLGVKTRIRSFSHLDQQSGRIVSWSRQSYYASLVPSDGLKYPADSVVWPLEEWPVVNRPGPRHQFGWEDDGQVLKTGYLSSRRLTQFMVIRTTQTKARLQVAQSKPNTPPQVTSALEGTIERLVLCDKSGALYESSGVIKPGESQALKPLTKEDAERIISQIAIDHRPEFPEGYDAVAEERRAYSGWGRRYWSGSSSAAVQETSLLETNLAGLQSSARQLLIPGSFVAVLETNPDVPKGISRAVEAESFHVLVGTW